MADLVETERLQREVWGLRDLDIVPAAQLRAALHAGGHVLGAFRGTELIGFAYALVATAHGRGMAGTGLHSHMVAVRANDRGAGVGRALKWHQRRLALAQGLPWITWTFDPLQAKNARLNFEHLGVVSHDYLVDFYGEMYGPLGGGQASDRLLALWTLESPRVRRLAAAQTALVGDRSRPAANEPDVVRRQSAEESVEALEPELSTAGAASETWLLSESDVDASRPDHHASLEQIVRGAALAFLEGHEAGDSATSRVARVAAPRDVTALFDGDPGLAGLWRTGIRGAMSELLPAGWVVCGFREGGYVLVPSEAKAEPNNL